MNYIGFDLGDGESSIALLKKDKHDAEVVIIDGKESFPTAVGTLKNTHNNIIGNNAIINETNCDNFRVNFKQFFTNPNIDTYDCYRRFIQVVLENLREKISYDLGDTKKYRFAVGHPAGWDDATIQKYKSLLNECFIKDPILVSESRAALVYYASSLLLDSSYANKSSSNSILICDFGSSTLDFAFMPNGVTDNIQILGHKKLGGGLLDKQIVLNSIQNIKDTDKRKQVEEAINNNKSILSLLLFRARQLKEKYFNSNDDTVEFSKNVFVGKSGIDNVNIIVNKKIIDSCLNKPLEECDNKSFIYSLESTLKEVFYKIKSKPADFVILTGGASRMKFFRQICMEELLSPNPIFSQSPETDIAKGLAMDGNYKSRLAELKNDVDNFVHDDLIINNIVTPKILNFEKSFAQKVAKDILSTDNLENLSLLNNINEWVKHGKTLKELNEILKEKLEEYFTSVHFSRLMSQELDSWFNELVLPDVQNRLNHICDIHKISANKVQLKHSIKIQKINFDKVKISNFNYLVSLALKIFNFASIIPLSKFMRKINSNRIYSYSNENKMAERLRKELHNSTTLEKDIKQACKNCIIESIESLEYEVKI